MLKLVKFKNVLPSFKQLLTDSNIFKQSNLLNMANLSSRPHEIDRFVWFDAEMTGLDIDTDYLMEVACIVTDSNLNVLGKSSNIVIHQPIEILTKMDSWCTKTHTASGLYQLCLESKVSVEEAEEQLLSLITPLTAAKKCYLAGNSLHMDREFLRKFMPRFLDRLHYRILDVSSLKLLANSWYGIVKEKKLLHRALDDVIESIDELKYYSEKMFIKFKKNDDLLRND